MTMMEKLLGAAVVLFLALLVLRIAQIASLSWIAVTAPLWAYGVLGLIAIVLFFAMKIEKARPE